MKVNFHTTDIFGMKSISRRKAYFDFCRKQALNAGLTCKCIIRDQKWMLELWGPRWQFLRYYLKTYTWQEEGLNGIKRFVSFII